MNRKTVLVTGSSRGIGRSTIMLFAQNNYDVVINYVNDYESALSLKNEVETKYGVDALCIKADVSEEVEVSNMVDEIISKFGDIDCLVNNAGIAIDTVYPESLDYDASKAGVISLTKNLAIQYAPYIRVNSVAPGWVMTDMNKELDSDFIKAEEEKILLKRFAKPEDIAKVIYFLASDDACYINSEIIRVDGGFYV